MLEGDSGSTLGFLLLLGGGLGVALVRAVSRSSAAKAAARIAFPACAVCGEPNRDGHGCHLEAIGRAVGSRKNYNGSYGRTWDGLVRDHYGTLALFPNRKHRCDDEPCGHSERFTSQCGHGHKYQREAQLCAWNYLRAVQSGKAAEGLVVGPRPGSETVAHRVPLTDIDWPRMLRDADFRCHYCGDQFEAAYLEKEHKTPLSRGGTNHESNIVVSCGPCNREKGRMTEAEFREFRAKVEHRTHDGRALGRKRSSSRRATQKPTERKPKYPGPCPCGDKFVLRSGPYGRFYGCARFPRCKETRPLAKNLNK